MARAQRLPKFLHVGVDVSQRTLAVAFRSLQGEVAEATFSNSEDGIRDLLRLIRAGRRPRRVVVESTGAYGLALCLALVDAGIPVMIANPLATRRFAEAQMIRAKTDRVDARVLLEFAERMAFVPWDPPGPGVRELRSLAGRIQTLVELRTADLNRLHAIRLDRNTPEVVRKDIEESIEALERRVEALVAAAMQLIEDDQKLAEAHCIITSTPGIADRSAIQILSHLLVLPQDMTPRQVVAFAGLDPHTVESGTSVRGPAHISRRGSRALRNALYMPVLAAIRFSPPVAAAYEALQQRGKPKKVAQVALMRRLLQATWQMLRTKQVWDPRKFGQPQIST